MLDSKNIPIHRGLRKVSETLKTVRSFVPRNIVVRKKDGIATPYRTDNIGCHFPVLHSTEKPPIHKDPLASRRKKQDKQDKMRVGDELPRDIICGCMRPQATAEGQPTNFVLFVHSGPWSNLFYRAKDGQNDWTMRSFLRSTCVL